MSRHRQMARVSRVASLIHSRPGHYACRALADRCDSSLGTIQRDIQVEYVERGGQRGYIITSEYFLPATELIDG